PDPGVPPGLPRRHPAPCGQPPSLPAPSLPPSSPLLSGMARVVWPVLARLMPDDGFLVRGRESTYSRRRKEAAKGQIWPGGPRMATMTEQPTDTLIGDAPAVAELRDQIRLLSAFDAPGNPNVPTVLLQGETGTGK